MRWITELPSGLPDVVGLDIETTGLDPLTDEIVLVQLAVPGEVYFIAPEYLECLRPVLTDRDCLKVIQHAAFDTKFLYHNLGVWTNGVWDTHICERLLTSGLGLRTRLQDIADRRLGVYLDKTAQETFLRYRGGSLTPEQERYAAQDAAILLDFYPLQLEAMKAEEMEHIADLENDLTIVTAAMEYEGILFDDKLFETYKPWMVDELVRLNNLVQEGFNPEELTIDLWGGGVRGVNLNSFPQLLEAFKNIGFDLKGSTNKETLKRFKGQHPNFEGLLEWRSLDKLMDFDYSKAVGPDGRVHAGFHQLGTVTGRYSSSKPNMQNVPRPEESKPNFRKLFRARPGYKMITADYSQQEIRMLAQMTNDPGLRQALEGADFHAEVAKILYDDPTITKGNPLRDSAKNCVYAMAYGSGINRFAATADVSVEKARETLTTLRKKFPKVELWAKQQLQSIGANGYVKDIAGRRIYFPKTHDIMELKAFSSVARNYPIQGGSATSLKMAKRDIFYNHLYDMSTQQWIFPARIVSTVHDEIVIEVKEDYVGEAVDFTKGRMADSGRLLCPDVPIVANVVVEDTWVK